MLSIKYFKKAFYRKFFDWIGIVIISVQLLYRILLNTKLNLKVS